MGVAMLSSPSSSYFFRRLYNNYHLRVHNDLNRYSPDEEPGLEAQFGSLVPSCDVGEPISED
jgi:hypothetical protein